MKNKKGFTLVELLGVIFILILLGLIVTPKVKNIISANRLKGYHEIERRLEEAAAKYVVNEHIDASISSIRITKENLIAKNYIKEIYDLEDNTTCDAYVLVSNLQKIAKFNAVLICSSYKTEINLIQLIVDWNGGATHIATTSGLLSTLSSNKDAILIVAGGGGGGGYYSSSDYGQGGHGGGYTGNTGSTSYSSAGGSGGTQASGAGFGYGTSTTGGTGGGGGFYGGKNGTDTGAGGGSDYIGNSLLISKDSITKHMVCYSCATSTTESTYTTSVTTVSATPTADTPKEGNGYAKITFLSQ